VKIAYGWIREFVALDLEAAEAADHLQNAGIEVASVARLAPDLRGVVVAEIEAIERELGESHGHRLRLCRVSTGRERFRVVCGAPNATVGARAAFAPPGAVLPGAAPVAVAAIRGVQSQGMLCSERELGLGDVHEAGLLLLDRDAPLGTSLVAYLGLDDHVLDVEPPPNRPDCLSVVGVARELAALTGAGFTPPALAVKESDEPVTSLARVRIEDPDLCHRFTARVISDVKVAPSPARLAARLRAVGLRPISNVVDVTNYVMRELGHPLHAFDHAKVAEATIVVRRARPGERLTTLDGQDRALPPSALLIADPAGGIGIAGVMGGANTEVTGTTSRVLLESAYFLPASIRRTARALGLATDAAYRFERGADIDGLVDASDRAAQLIAEVAEGSVARGMVDAYPTPRPRPRIRLRLDRVRRVVGVAPPPDQARRILVGLGLSTADHGDDLDVEVPSFRRDLTLEDDLVEEIIRVWGYDKIPSTPLAGRISFVEHPPTLEQARVARRALVGAGLAETITYSFSDPAHADVLPGAGDGARPVELLNPLSQEASRLRQHPLEGVLGVVAANVRRRHPSVRVFEIARTYALVDAGTAEPRWVAVALTGARHDPAWYHGGEQADVYDAKGLAEHVLAAFGVRATPAAGRLPGFEPDAHGALATAEGAVVAEFGEVATTVRERLGIETPVFAAVVALDAVAAVTVPTPRHAPLPRFPSVERDMAFLIDADQTVTAAAIEAAIREAAGPWLRDVSLFDVFRFPDGRRSLAWRLLFQADDRTLTDDEVNAIHGRVTRRVSAQLNITLRGAE
jgi:phenylalanyl-tRNA synthetase beta chain